MQLTDFLGLFSNVLPQDGYYMASCPVPGHGRGNGDRHPSLKVTLADEGKFLVHCFGGCTQEQVLDALGLTGSVRVEEGGLPSLSGEGGTAARHSGRTTPPPPPVPDSVADFRHDVYTALLTKLRLTGEHYVHLEERGLTGADIVRADYRSLESLGQADQSILFHELRTRFGDGIAAVPGLDGKGLGRRAGLLVPFRDPAGRILGMQVRQFTNGPRYLWFGGGDGLAKSTPHVPLACTTHGGVWAANTVRLTEGGLKADVIVALEAGKEMRVQTVGVGGATNWAAAVPVLKGWGSTTVRLAFDQDAPGQKAAKKAASALLGMGFQVEIEAWDAAHKGLDDALAAGAERHLLEPFPLRYKVASEVAEEPLEWLWEGWVPRGMLTVLDGDPGVSKSTLAWWLTARVTNGGREGGGRPGTVLILNAEDDQSRVMRPRLRLAGADLSRVVFLEGLDGEEGLEPIYFPKYLAAVRYAILKHQARLVVIDPVMSYLDSSTDSYKDQHVRAALSGLHKVAGEAGCAVLLLRHLNKALQQRGQYRGMGSVGFVGLARSCIMMGHHPDAPDGRSNKRVIGVYKSNNAELPAPREVEITSVPGQFGGTHPVAELGPACPFSIFDVLSASGRKADREAAQMAVDKKAVAKHMRQFGTIPVEGEAWEAKAKQLKMKPERLLFVLASMGWAGAVEAKWGGKVYEPQRTYIGEENCNEAVAV